MMKRFITVLMAVCMLFSLISTEFAYAYTIIEFVDEPVVITPFVDEDKTGEELLNDMENANVTTPNGFNDSSSNPYGLNGSDVVNLLQKNEIFEFVSINNKVERKHLFRYVENSTDSNVTALQNGYKQTGVDDPNGYLNKLQYAQGVAFDPMGCGRKNYVAVLGLYTAGGKDDYTNQETRVVIIDADECKVVGSVQITVGGFLWISADGGLDTVDSKNFFQITAGDYDGDGSDSLVVWDGTNLVEIWYEYNKSGIDYSWQRTSGNLNRSGFGGTANAPFLHPYQYACTTSGYVRDRLGVAMESGDINGDGIDDLVIVSYTQNMSDEMYDLYSTLNHPFLTCVLGGQKGKNRLSSMQTSEYKYLVASSHNSGSNVTMVSPGVSIGDIDGDGANEIVAAGFRAEGYTCKGLKNDGSMTYVWYDWDSKSGKLKTGRWVSEYTDTSPICGGDSLRKNEKNWQQFSVECVQIDGINTKEYVFLNGYLYQLKPDDTNGAYFTQVCNPSEFSTLVTSVYGEDVNEVWIHSAAVGNFYQNNKGKEALILIVGYKRNGNNMNYFQRVILRKNDNGQWVEEKYWDGSQYKVRSDTGLIPTVNNSYEWDGCDGNKSLSCILVAVDYGYDSTIAKYNSKDYMYTDPNVIAVLQAAPYFKDIGAGDSETVYSYTESYLKSTTTGYEFSWGVGIAAELESPAAKLEVEETITHGITEEFTESLTTSFTTEFVAGEENQVIVRRTLVYLYYYDVLTGVDRNGNDVWEKCGVVISVPQYPVMTQMSIDEYNSFAAKFNEMYGAGTINSASYYLQTISDENIGKYYLDNEGNPYKYASNTSSYAQGYELNDGTWMQLGHASGKSRQEYTVELSQETSKTVSEGVSCNIKLLFGAGWGSFGAYAGVQASMDYLRSSGVSTGVIKTTSTAGQIQNLTSNENGYNFRWKLIGWKTTDLFPGVLFVGYAVDPNSISALPIPVDDLTATYPSDRDNHVMLKWTSPEADANRPSISRFNIYLVTDNGKESFLGYVDYTGSEKEHRFYYDIDKLSQASITVIVKSMREGNPVLISLPSNEASCVLTLKEKEIRKLIEAARKDLEDKIKALEEASDSDLADAIEDLTIAYKDADEALDKKYGDITETIKSDLEDLEKELKAADDLLEKAINDIQENLDKAVEELNGLISDGDTRADELEAAIDDLTLASEAANAVLQSNIDILSDRVTDLEKAMKEADNALRLAIDEVQENLDKAVEALNKAISDGNKASADALKKAVDSLTKAYKSADTLIKADIRDMSNRMSELEKSLKDADGVLQNAIDKVQENLNTAKQELQNAIDNNQIEVTNRLNSLRNALEAADAVINNEITSLKNMDKAHDEMIATINEAIDALKVQFASLADELTDLKNQIERDNRDYDNLIDALEKVNEAQQNELGTWKTISIVGLSVASVSLVGVALPEITKLINKRKV